LRDTVVYSIIASEWPTVKRITLSTQRKDAVTGALKQYDGNVRCDYQRGLRRQRAHNQLSKMTARICVLGGAERLWFTKSVL
jgi:hypothetical protein